tara:strand:- start:292 stop:837 length:546 start_codon:yes stop_codon:yes gene_type:complete
MSSEIRNQVSIKNPITVLVITFLGLISVILIFKNTFFASSLALKSFGEISMDPEVALHNEKPTFIEFYAEWCEVCKEMASGILDLKNDYQNEINFVFLNVDNPKWEKYINQFNVNGIPKMVFLNNDSELKTSLVGLNDEALVDNSLNNLLNSDQEVEIIAGTKFSKTDDNKRKITYPRSHS